MRGFFDAESGAETVAAAMNFLRNTDALIFDLRQNGGGVRLSEHFGMFVPTGRAINPITKANWEGTGVKPDIEVAADMALNTAQLTALKKLIGKADERFKGDFQRRIEELQKASGQPSPEKK